MLKFLSFDMSATGASHIDKHKICQDTSASLYEATGKYAIAAVSDGHGGDLYFRSDVGSKIAATEALNCVEKCFLKVDDEGSSYFVKKFLSDKTSEREKEELITQLERSVVQRWNDIINELIAKNPFTKEELSSLDKETANKLLRAENVDSRVEVYGCTLIVAAVYERFWFGFQIGDGTFVVKRKDKFIQPIELDEKCTGTHTTSICEENAINQFHHSWGFEPPDAILIASDGVDESFETVNGLYKFYNNVVKNSLEDWNDNTGELTRYLPKLSEKGSRDDVSLAAIINIGQTFEDYREPPKNEESKLVRNKVESVQKAKHDLKIQRSQPIDNLISFKIYKKISDEGRNYFVNYENENDSTVGPPNFKSAYFDILKTIIYELVVFKKSELLIALNQTYGLTPNLLEIGTRDIMPRYDALYIAAGLYGLISGASEDIICRKFFNPVENHLFRNKLVSQARIEVNKQKYVDYLRNVFKKLGIYQQSEVSNNSQGSFSGMSEEQSHVLKVPDSQGINEKSNLSLSEKLRKLSFVRQSSDERLYAELKNIQTSLQKELKNIHEITDKFEYTHNMEAINQIVSIFNMISQVLDYHLEASEKTDDLNYRKLTSVCVEVLEVFKESLSLLGVSVIDKTKVQFDAAQHSVSNGLTVKRTSMVETIKRVGFTYKDQVIQKALVTVSDSAS